MTWGNPPPFNPTPAKKPKPVTPEQLAATGSEDGHQSALFCWAAMNTDKYPQLKWMFAIPNGGSRHIAEAVKFVGTGTRSGVPDIFLPAPIYKNQYLSLMHHGMFIEMKKLKKGRTSDNQDDWLDYLQSAGYYCRVCYSWTEARDELIKYLEGKV